MNIERSVQNHNLVVYLIVMDSCHPICLQVSKSLEFTRVGDYRVSSKTVCTSILLFSWVTEHIQKNFWPFFNSPEDEDFKTHLTFLPTWKIDQVTAQNVRQTGFWKYHLMADFAFFSRGLPTLGSIISVISKAIFKILVPILLQISWIFQNTPNI